MLQYFGHLMWRADSMEKTLMLRKIEAKGEQDDSGWGGLMASLIQWTWVWVNSGSWLWTAWPGMLQSVGSQRVRHDWATELNCTERQKAPPSLCVYYFWVEGIHLPLLWLTLYNIFQLSAAPWSHLLWTKFVCKRPLSMHVFGDGAFKKVSKVEVKSLSRVRLFVIPWTVAHQASLSMGFPRWEHWSLLPFPPPGDLPGPRIKPTLSCISRQILDHWVTWEAHPRK